MESVETYGGGGLGGGVSRKWGIASSGRNGLETWEPSRGSQDGKRWFDAVNQWSGRKLLELTRRNATMQRTIVKPLVALKALGERR